jgi:hypothetical protein
MLGGNRNDAKVARVLASWLDGSKGGNPPSLTAIEDSVMCESLTQLAQELFPPSLSDHLYSMFLAVQLYR